jgi:Na+-driven multidrug efflux pump
LTYVATVVQVVILSPFAAAGDRSLSTIVGVSAGFGAGVLLYYAPAHVLGLKLKEAAAEFDAFLSWLSVHIFGQTAHEV